MADCWGTATLLAQCREDGKWHPYGEHLKGNTVEPMRHLCQPETVNSIICGRRPRYRRPVFPHFSYSGVQQWPWLSTLFRNFTYACTATIISQDFMITAAHCVTTSEVSRKIVDKRGLTVQYLSDDGRVRSSYLTEVHIHPSYMGGSRPGKDIALLKLERPVTFSHKVVPACLGTESFPEASIAATFNHSGGNETHWNVILQQYDQRCQIPQDRCQTLDIDTDQFCAIDIGGLSFLPKGASGGPFLVNLGNDVKEEWTVEGIVSAASGVYLCKRPFTIFSRVSDFWPWIRNCVHNAVCS
ncbi:hypothetical protein SK128_012062 [Halocaridina rubra]|uniref:Peptidase S1 domain-containing protein n=1 Tax=Halocaridina rubra TaxID=373956 RepID=A0AAN8WIM6_HALRR